MSSNNIGSIYATTISSEKYIVIASQNIELSGNVIMKDNVTISNGTLNCNSLIPNVNNSTSLGTTSSSWSNAYFHDLSVNNNLQVLGNVKIGGNLDVSNIYTKNYIDNSFANVYTRSQIAASFENVYTLSQIDLSFQNVNISEEIDLSFANVYTRTHVDLSFQNVHTIREIDLSFQNVYIRRAIDLSFANVNISGQIDQSFANVHTRGYIDTSFQNVYIRRAIDLSFANVNISGQIDISFANVHTRGYVDTSFQNVYTIKQIDTSFANVYTRGVIDTSFRTLYTRLQVDNSFANVHTRKAIDSSYANIYIRRAIDLSFANVNISGQIDQSFANVYTRGHVDLSFRNIYIRSVIDQSFQNVYTRSQADLSFVSKRVFDLSYNALAAIGGSGGGDGSTIVLSSISGNIIPALNNTYSLGSTTKFWNNSYINNLRVSNRAYQDINSGPFYEINSTVQTWEWHRSNALGLGKSLATILSAEQNEKIRLLLVAGGISAALIGASRTATSSATGKTSADWQWVNGDIWSYTNFNSGEPNGGASEPIIEFLTNYGNGTWNDVGSGTTRPAVYMSYREDISWNAVNGYYGLAKDAYPGLNPLSSGVKAVSTWTLRSSAGEAFFGICWSPKLGLFVATAGSARTSNNGINWTSVTLPAQAAQVCWSQELELFVAAGAAIMSSSTGAASSWTISSSSSSCRTVCWSPQLGLFVVVTNGASNNVITSNNGTTWAPMSVVVSEWSCICWSPELGLFVAVSASNGRVMTSKNGSIWVQTTVSYTGQWATVCWSSALGIFVSLTNDGRGMTSNNGTSWTLFNVPSNLHSVCWSPDLELFVASSTNNVSTSANGVNWTTQSIDTASQPMYGVCWSPELGIFAFAGFGGRIMTSSLKGCPPTSYNVFDASANASVTMPASTGSGGTISTSGSYTIHSFTAVGTTTFTISSPVSIDYLVVAGGGAGGVGIAGGGGAGGVLSGTTTLSAGSYTITVGAGGASVTSDRQGNDGGSSSISTLIVTTGGGGGGGWIIPNGRNGGSGGGQNAANGGTSGGTGIIGQGFAGATYVNSSCGGGGAGASASGSTGGIGITSNITGTTKYYAGGGGGAGASSYGIVKGVAVGGIFQVQNGTYGGGNGTNTDGTKPAYTDAVANTGGGGGGAEGYNGPSGAGGSGIVVIRYITTGGTANVSSNSIAENGTWSFANVVTTGTLTVNTKDYNSDDRLKHNEAVIVNGLEVIDKLCPKFYQKTQTLLDASYNGDLSGHTWTYEAGLIAQEVLQVPDLSFVVSGGDYYQVNHILRSKLNPPSYPHIYYEQKMNYDLSFAISYYQQKMNTDLSFDASYNTLQILSYLRMDASYTILKMNNDLIFDACYNEQKIISDLSSQDQSINDLSYSYYYELSNNVIAQPYALNYNSVFVYGLAAIKELHAKVKAQDISLLSQQTIINSLTTRMEALETDPNNS